MAAISVNIERAKELLLRAWSKIADQRVEPPTAVGSLLEAVFGSSNVTFKYILVTGLLGKCTDPRIHPRALQTSSKLKRAYDARSLCHKVVVTFEKTKGDLWGLSNEPFVNKPARHPQHDKSNPQLRDKELATKVHDALEFAHQASANDVFAMLVHALRLGKLRADSQVVAVAEQETTHHRVVDFVREFLKESDGGTRLVAIVGAFLSLLNERFTVKVFPPNYSDRFARTAGDVEVLCDQARLSAYECKHRPLSLDDVHHGIHKARDCGVSEYCFVFAAGLVAGQESSIRDAIVAGSSQSDILLLDTFSIVESWSGALNPIRRGRFGEVVTRILRDDMRRIEVANKAAELWNPLKQ